MNNVEKNLKEFKIVFEELKDSIENYKTLCPRLNTKLKKEECCQEAREYLIKIIGCCDELYLISKRDPETTNLIKEEYGDGFVADIDHFPFQHHEIGCMKEKCEATPGGVIFLDKIIKEIETGHKINNSHLSRKPEGENIYA